MLSAVDILAFTHSMGPFKLAVGPDDLQVISLSRSKVCKVSKDFAGSSSALQQILLCF